MKGFRSAKVLLPGALILGVGYLFISGNSDPRAVLTTSAFQTAEAADPAPNKPASGAQSKPPVVDEDDADEILSRLMQYEQRILELESGKAPSPFVPEADEVGRDRGGDATGEIFISKERQAAPVPSLVELSEEKKQLSERVSQLEHQLAASEELVRELKKVRPSSEQLSSLESETKKRDEEIHRLNERIAELERAQTLPQLRADNGAPTRVAAVVPTSEHREDKLPKAQEKIRELTGALDKSREREQKYHNELSQVKSEIVQAHDEVAQLKKTLATLRGAEREKGQIEVQFASLREQVAGLEAELEKRKNVEVNNGYLRKEVEDAKVRITELEAQLTAKGNLQGRLDKALAEIQQLTKQRDELSKERSALNTKAEEAKQELARLREVRSGSETKLMTVEKELEDKQQELTELNRQLSRTIQDAKDCATQLAASEKRLAKLSELEDALIKAKNDLLLKETEIRMLSADAGGRSSGLDTPNVAPERVPSPRTAPARDVAARVASGGKAPAAGRASDVLIVEVIAKKVNLRSGPGSEHSPVMQVQAGTRLTVESKEGDWYRVLTPTGSRAFIRSDVVREPTGGTGPAQPVVKSGAAELEPFGTPNRGAARRSIAEDEETKAFESLKASIRGGS